MKQLAAWYQKKISSYDKKEWETMVEQLLMRGTYRRRIVDFSSHARSYLIDVDLDDSTLETARTKSQAEASDFIKCLITDKRISRSSFPKAKPTLGMRRVVWFALVRLVFLPGLHQWWAQQTSPACAKILLALWLMQVFNVTLYFTAPADLDVDANCWMVPLGLMLVLSVVHSQIVSTTEMELARVRPRSTYRRKLPRYFRRTRSECDGGSGGGSAESGATSSQGKANKPTKFRRRQSRTDIADNGLRKRKKELIKENLIKKLDSPIKNKPLTKVKAKDSDDEDYMPWKKPDLTAPIVTFTPPNDDATPSTSFGYKANLTKKHLETFNIRQSQQANIARAIFADGDDGFESLNGYNSNGSDVENKTKEIEVEVAAKESEAISKKVEMSDDKECSNVPKQESPKVKVEVNSTMKEDDEKSVELESDGGAPTSSPTAAKRVGVRFRGSWIQDAIRKQSSDDEFTVKKKHKKLDNYQSSSSDGECSASAPSIALPSHHTMSDWVGQTTNSEESSYGSQSEGGHSDVEFHYAADSSWDPFALLDPTSDTVKCTMWERGSTLRTELSAVDISWYVVARAERAMAADGCLWAGIVMAAAIALFAPISRLVQVAIDQETRSEEELQAMSPITYIPCLVISYSQGSIFCLFNGAFGDNFWEISMNMLSCVLRFVLSGLVFFLLAVAERAYKQRFLYAKLFSHLTSARRARKSELPHFRLNTVRNIKTWLSTRSYLREEKIRRKRQRAEIRDFAIAMELPDEEFLENYKVGKEMVEYLCEELEDNLAPRTADGLPVLNKRRGPQRSVDVIVSAAFIVTLTLLACVSAQLLRDSITLERFWVIEAMLWSTCLGIYLLRLLTLGSNVNRKYRGCLSAILTEQINLHLAIEQRPESKEQLTVANNVLKLAADLLKELDSPFKISGICANHYLYTITKVVILSALSGVLSEMLGFKLKLHKIKIK